MPNHSGMEPIATSLGTSSSSEPDPSGTDAGDPLPSTHRIHPMSSLLGTSSSSAPNPSGMDARGSLPSMQGTDPKMNDAHSDNDGEASGPSVPLSRSLFRSSSMGQSDMDIDLLDYIHPTTIGKQMTLSLSASQSDWPVER